MAEDSGLPRGIFLTRGRQFVVGLSNKSLAFFWRHKRFFIAGLFLFIAILAFGAYVKSAFFILLLTAIASFSTYYKKYIKFTIGFEFVTFSTVLATVAYGPWIGAAVGLVSSVAAEVLPQLIDPSSFFWILSLPVSAFVVAFFHSMNVPLFWLGFVSLAIQFLFSEPMRIFSGDEYLKMNGYVNIVATTAWTVLWFKLLAPPVLSLIA